MLDCRHCRMRIATRCRGLCRICYYQSAIRECYGRLPRSCNRQGVALTAPTRPPDRPTAALPGSQDKVLVLMARAEAGVDLWSPDDATGWEDEGEL
jgi:hypothetical protein